MKKLLSIHGNKMIWHGEDIESVECNHSFEENTQPEKEMSEEEAFEGIVILPDVEILKFEDDEDVRDLHDGLDNIPRVNDNVSDIEPWDLNSSERKNQAYIIQVGQLLESGIITMEEREKLIDIAKDVFI